MSLELANSNERSTELLKWHHLTGYGCIMTEITCFILVFFKCLLIPQEDCTRLPPVVPSSFNHSVIFLLPAISPLVCLPAFSL